MPRLPKTKLTTLLKRFGDPLTVHDWFFDECAEEEQRPCFYYEYLRESHIIRRLWQRWADFDPVRQIDCFPPDIHNRYWLARKCLKRRLNLDRKPFEKGAAIIRAPWPKIPWLDLTPSQKAGRTWKDPFAATVTPKVSIMQLEQLVELLPQLAVPERICVLRIPEGANRRDVEDVFKREIAEFSKQNPGYFEENERGQSGVEPKLRKLAAKRLRSVKAYFGRHGAKVSDEQLIEY